MTPDETDFMAALTEFAHRNGGKVFLEPVGQRWMVRVVCPNRTDKCGSEGGRSCLEAARKLCETLGLEVAA